MSSKNSNLEETFSTGRLQLYKGSSKSGGYSREHNGFSPTISNGYPSRGRRIKKQRGNLMPEDKISEASFDSLGKQKSFHRIWARFADKTSMTGIPYIYNAKLLWAKIAWTILTIIAIAAMILHLYFLIDQYYSWPKITKVSLGFSNLRFPDVTICNTNIMKYSELQKLEHAEELKNVVDYLNPSNLAPNVRGQGGSGSGAGTGNTAGGGSAGTNTGTNTGSSAVRRKRFVEKHRGFNFSDFNYKNPAANLPPAEDEFKGEIDLGTEIYSLFTSLYMDLPRYERSQIGHQISDMLVSCTFNGRICGSGMFKLHQTSEFGNCWTLGAEDFIVKTSGPSAGLQLVLYMETTEYIPGITNGYGARLTISEPDTYPYPFDEGLDISSSMETSIGLKMLSITRLGTPYGTCEDGESFANQYNTAYSRRACQTVCEANALLDKCGCFEDGTEEVVLTKNSTYRPCRSEREKECMLNYSRHFDSQEMNCGCSNPCIETQYVKSVSQRQWPSDAYADILLQDICERQPSVCDTLKLKDIRSLSYNFLKLNIYYEDLNYEAIEEDPEIEFTQFLSDVGGAVGLWIGLSVLAFCEIFQLVIELCYYGIHKIKKKQNREKEREKERNKRSREKRLEKSYNSDEKFGQWPHTEFDQYVEKDIASTGLARSRDITATTPPDRGFHGGY